VILLKECERQKTLLRALAVPDAYERLINQEEGFKELTSTPFLTKLVVDVFANRDVSLVAKDESFYKQMLKHELSVYQDHEELTKTCTEEVFRILRNCQIVKKEDSVSAVRSPERKSSVPAALWYAWVESRLIQVLPSPSAAEVKDGVQQPLYALVVLSSDAHPDDDKEALETNKLMKIYARRFCHQEAHEIEIQMRSLLPNIVRTRRKSTIEVETILNLN